MWLKKVYGTEESGFTREVCWRERVFDLIDIRLKLVDFKLEIWKELNDKKGENCIGWWMVVGTSPWQ